MALGDRGRLGPRTPYADAGLTAMVFSPQQVKFELLSYIKEFGGKADEWQVGCAVDAKAALEGEQRVDLDRDIWLWKPTLSPNAARIVHRYFTQQLGVPDAGAAAGGANIFLFKRRVDPAI